MCFTFMKTDTNIGGHAEAGVQTQDFAERVRVNQAKLASELKCAPTNGAHQKYDLFDPDTHAGAGRTALIYRGNIHGIKMVREQAS